MTHIAKMIEKKQIGDGAIAVRLRCCGDENTDSISTIYLKSDSDLKGWLAREKERVQNQHESTQLALNALGALEE